MDCNPLGKDISNQYSGFLRVIWNVFLTKCQRYPHIAIYPSYPLLVISTFIKQGNRGFLLLRLQHGRYRSAVYLLLYPWILQSRSSDHHLLSPPFMNSKSAFHPNPPQQKKEFMSRSQTNTPYQPRRACRVATCLPSQAAISNIRSLKGTCSFFPWPPRTTLRTDRNWIQV